MSAGNRERGTGNGKRPFPSNERDFPALVPANAGSGESAPVVASSDFDVPAPIVAAAAALPVAGSPYPVPRFALIAGEVSGDQLGAGLIAELRRRHPHAQFAGVGGEAMRDAGLDAWYDCSALAVMGLAEVVRHLPRLLRLRRALRARLLWSYAPPQRFTRNVTPCPKTKSLQPPRFPFQMLVSIV